MDEGMKRCTGCGRNLAVSCFGWKERSAGTRKSRCQDCQREYQRRWYIRDPAAHRQRNSQARRERHDRNRALVNAAKAVPCADCGVRYDVEQMDFDHVRGQKVGNLASMAWQMSTERIIDEIAKCEVVCAVCHRIRTQMRPRR